MEHNRNPFRRFSRGVGGSAANPFLGSTDGQQVSHDLGGNLSTTSRQCSLSLKTLSVGFPTSSSLSFDFIVKVAL
jgi:hypothetical protein